MCPLQARTHALVIEQHPFDCEKTRPPVYLSLLAKDSSNGLEKNYPSKLKE